VEAKRGGQCGWREALREGRSTRGKLVKSRPGKLKGRGQPLFEPWKRQRVQIPDQVKAHQKTSFELELLASRREAKNYAHLLDKF